jgi:hypothetical protein
MPRSDRDDQGLDKLIEKILSRRGISAGAFVFGDDPDRLAVKRCSACL